MEHGRKALGWLAAIAVVAWLGMGMSLCAAEVDINSADAATLAQELKGVGESKARAIVADREQKGPFHSVDDLTRVKGIGPRIVDDNRGQLTVGGPGEAAN